MNKIRFLSRLYSLMFSSCLYFLSCSIRVMFFFSPDKTQHSQETDIHAPSGIRTHHPSKRAAADPRLRQVFSQQNYIFRVYHKLMCPSWLQWTFLKAYSKGNVLYSVYPTGRYCTFHSNIFLLTQLLSWIYRTHFEYYAYSKLFS